ncbi:TonB-dependent receptor [uncultured Bacteroides sp.]|uniref:SusC/RagA family TonB-linked outer membrane protein n=1 Tax=uncultured Bacteroides sp. TaxID=162156 RepID=UPI002AAB5B24|nr:TonB-dependent receptor [uncultured Bacteroides sp.]
MKKAILLCCYLFLWQVSFGQNLQISGVVTSADDGNPLPGANIAVKGILGMTAVTDLNGEYSIAVPKGKSLVFSFIGCKNQEKVINVSGHINVTLESDAKMLEEVVAIGYGTMKKSDLTGAVATINAETLKRTPASGLDQALQGRAAGVTVNANSGQPGKGAEVRIRGIGTVNGASPIYVVDNVIVSDISFLNSNDVASTEILKDASSTAIYGSRGANGVILITTKKGTVNGRSEISFNTYAGWQNRWNKLDLMKRDEFANTLINMKGLKSEMSYYEKNGLNGWLSAYRMGSSPYYPVILSKKNPNGVDYSSIETDWQDEVFKRNAMIQNYHLSIDGSTDKSSYSFSGSYFNQDGTIMGSYYKRLTLRSNTSFQIRKWLKIGENLSFAYSTGRNAMNNNASAGASILSAALAMAPWDPTHYPSGAANKTGEDLSGRISASSNFKNVTNPFSMAENSYPSDKTERWVGDLFFEITPIKGLILRSNLNLDLSNTRSKLFKPAYVYSDYDKNDKNFLSSGMGRYSTIAFENTITYAKKIMQHDFSLMAGYTAEEYNYYTLGGSGSSILNPERTNWFLSQTTEDRSYANDNIARNRRSSFLGRAHYSYNDRYLITLNFRADGSSMFPENKWGYFPSMALGWKISEENWMKGFSNLDFLKLRAGWGRIGNDKIGSDSFILKMFNSGPSFVDYVLGTGNQTLANGATVLTYVNNGGIWETTEQWNIGLDFGLFKGLLSGNVDLFIRDTKDMLLTVKGPAYIGNRYDATDNVGTVSNKGIEITLDHKNKIGSINYSINGNVSFINNKLTALNGGQKIYSQIDNVVLCDQGLALYTLWGYKYEGIYKTDEEALNHLYSYSKDEISYHAGDARYADINLDGKIDEKDKTKLGNPFPWLTYGLNLGADWKGFDIQLFFQGVYGNKLYNQVRYRTEGKGEQATLSAKMRNVWTTNNPNGLIPNPYGSTNNYLASSRFVEDGSYLRLKNVQFGYTLPTKVTSKIGINRCRFYVSGSNLLTFTNYTGYDPEVGGGVDYGNYPQARTILVGANLNF